MKAIQEAGAQIGKFSDFHQGNYYGNGVFGPSPDDIRAAQTTKYNEKRTAGSRGSHNILLYSALFAPIVVLTACDSDPSYLVNPPSTPSEPAPSRPMVVGSTDNKSSTKPSDPIRLATVTPNANPTFTPVAKSEAPSAVASADSPASKPAEAKPSIPAVAKIPDLPSDYKLWICPSPLLPIALSLNSDWVPNLKTFDAYYLVIGSKPTADGTSWILIVSATIFQKPQMVFGSLKPFWACHSRIFVQL